MRAHRHGLWRVGAHACSDLSAQHFHESGQQVGSGGVEELRLCVGDDPLGQAGARLLQLWRGVGGEDGEEGGLQ